MVGVPMPHPTCEELASEVDDIVCAVTPEPFYAVKRMEEVGKETAGRPPWAPERASRDSCSRACISQSSTDYLETPERGKSYFHKTAY
jgi:hypothetical protein